VVGNNLTNNSSGTILGGANTGCNYLGASGSFTNSGLIGGASSQALLLASSPGGTVTSPATTSFAAEPANQIASPSLTISGANIVGTIANPGGSPAATNYIVLRRLNGNVDNASRPTDLSSYTIGQTLGNSVVVANNPSSELTFTDSNALANGCQQYNYSCFTYNATGGGCPNYNRTLGNSNRNSITTSTNAGSVTGGSNICSGSTSGTLTLSGSAGAILRWQWAISPFSTWTNISNTAATYTSGALTQTTQFRAVVNGGAGCADAFSAATTATVASQPTATAGAALVSCAGMAAVSMSGASASNATAISWSAGAGLGNWAGTGTNPATYTFTPTVSEGSFTATLSITGAAGCTTATATRIISWSSVPTVATTTPGGVCGSGTVALAGTASSGATLDWYSVLAGSAILAGRSGALTYTTPSLGTTTTYYAGARNTTSGCLSAVRTAVIASVDAPAVASAGAALTGCGPGLITQTGATVTGTVATVSWAGGTGLGSWSGSGANPATYTFTPSSVPGSFTATLTITSGGACAASVASTSSRTVAWYDAPGQPSYTNETRCGPGSLTLTAGPSVGETIDWYAAAIGGTALATGTLNYTTASISTTTTFFAAARDLISGCTSPRVGVVAAITFTPGVTQYRDGNNCGPGTVNISAVTTDDAVIDWFAAATGGSPLAVGTNLFTTPSLTATTLYYAQPRSSATGCSPTSRITVRAVITPPSSVAVNGGGPYCPGATATLAATGTNIVNQYWTGPNSFFSTAASLSLNSLAAANAGTYTVFASCLSGVNLIYNGDFELGNVGFTSAYTMAFTGGANDLVPEGTYGVMDNPVSGHPNFANCADRSPIGTKQMVINGAVTPDVTIWEQTVNIDPNTDYQFSYWQTSVVASSFSRLQLYINGVPAGPILTGPSVNCSWVQLYYNWSSGSATTARLTLVNQNTVATGNDFSLDDIIFQPACQSVASTNITVGLPPAPTTTPVARCGSGSVSITATLGHPWYTADWYSVATNGTILTGGTGVNPSRHLLLIPLHTLQPRAMPPAAVAYRLAAPLW